MCSSSGRAFARADPPAFRHVDDSSCTHGAFSRDRIAPAERHAAQRVANLDLLRAIAIGLVLCVNLVAERVVDLGEVGNRVFESGWVGVDLFFVLSGWLIGGLYWRERETFGNVQVGRFWARRWLRTLPPYVAAFLCVSAARTLVLHDGPPEWRYLVFVQNYATPIPYWSVSWSLCVEEHVYLALPIVLAIALRVRGGIPLVLGGLAFASLAARVWSVDDGASPWGLHYTATHMRLEGLALGVAAAAVYHLRPEAWPHVRRAGRVLVLPGLAFVASVPWLPVDVLNRFAYTGVDVACAALLVVVVEAPAFASSRAIRAVALTSYSVYMTHTAILKVYHGTVQVAFPHVPPGLHAVGALVAVGAVGAAFYAAVERPSLWLRRRIAPRRSGEPSPALAPVSSGGDRHETEPEVAAKVERNLMT